MAADLGSRSYAAYYAEALDSEAEPKLPRAAYEIACYASKAAVIPSVLTFSFERLKSPASDAYVQSNGRDLADCNAFVTQAMGGAACPADAAKTTPGLMQMIASTSDLMLRSYCSNAAAWERMFENEEQHREALGLSLTNFTIAGERCQIDFSGFTELDIRYRFEDMSCNAPDNGSARCTATAALVCGPRNGDLEQFGSGTAGYYCAAATGFENMMTFPAGVSANFDTSDCSWKAESINIMDIAFP